VGAEAYWPPSSTGTWATSWRLRGHAVPHQDRRAVHQAPPGAPADQEPAPAARQVPRHADQEQKYRQRYVDLITDEQARALRRAQQGGVSSIRSFMVEHGFLEVETPMLHPIPGGANAKPFVTHHNALDQEMFLRIAPELYLKRLLVGGFERVFEINRNFRNEGISVRHNPEFTMMEFYAAYWTTTT
jgi:lysyl-tRNA synthetase class II